MRATAARPLSIGAVWPAVPLPVALFGVAAAVRVLSFLVFYLGSLLTGHGGVIDPYDSLSFDAWAWWAAQHLAHGQLVDLRPWNAEGTWEVGFTYFVALQYVIAGHHSEVPRIVDALLAAFCAPATYWTARATPLGEVVARRAGWLVALWPLSVYWAGYDLLKDPATWFLMALAMLAVVSRTALRYVLLSAAAAGTMLLFRLYIAAGLYLFLPAAAAFQRRWKTAAATVGALLAIEAGMVATGFPGVWTLAPYQGNGTPLVQLPGTFQQGSLAAKAGTLAHDPHQTGVTQVAGPGSDAATTIGSSARSPRLLAERLVLGSLINILGPRPALKDVIHPTLDTGMYPGLLVWILLIPFTVLGLWRAIRLRDARVLALAGLCLGLWFGISFLFAGGGFREREMAFPVTLMFTSAGLERPFPRRWWWVYGAYLGLGVLAVLGRELGLF